MSCLVDTSLSLTCYFVEQSNLEEGELKHFFEVIMVIIFFHVKTEDECDMVRLVLT